MDKNEISKLFQHFAQILKICLPEEKWWFRCSGEIIFLSDHETCRIINIFICTSLIRSCTIRMRNIFIVLELYFSLCNKKIRCCYTEALVFTYFRLSKDRVTFFWPETVVACLLHFIVLICKVFIKQSTNHSVYFLQYIE